MKRIPTIILAACLTVLGAGAKNIKTVVFTTNPQMHCDNCENRIKKNVRFVSGVKKIETSIPQQTVTIEYDADKTTPEKIEQGFKKIGYEVQQVKADEPAQQPEDAPQQNP